MAVGYFCTVEARMLGTEHTEYRVSSGNKPGPVLVCRCHNVPVGGSSCCAKERRCEYSDACPNAATYLVWVAVPDDRPHWHMCEQHAREVSP